MLDFNQASGSGSVWGTVTDSSTQAPLEGVVVSIGSKTTITDSEGGYFLFEVPSGSQTISGAKTGYSNYSGTVTITADQATEKNFSLTPKSWGAAVKIENDDTGGAFEPQIAVGPGGNATVVWYQYDGTRENIWANRYTAGTGWGAAEKSEKDDTGNAWIPEVAIDSGGNPIAVWQQSDGTRDNIWANRYTAGTGWGAPEKIENDDTGDAWNPVVVFDSNGNAFAVWQQFDGARDNIWANRYTAGTGWGASGKIDSEDLGSAQHPQVAFDPGGNARSEEHTSELQSH